MPPVPVLMGPTVFPLVPVEMGPLVPVEIGPTAPDEFVVGEDDPLEELDG